MVDSITLIKLVARRKPLWDTRDLNYQNRDHARKLWNEIAVELGCSNLVVKSKWRGLRDVFRKETIKLEREMSMNNGGAKRPKWKYYNYLRFLTSSLKITKNDTETVESTHVKIDLEGDFDTQSSFGITDTADYDTDESQSVSAVGGAVDNCHADPLSDSTQVNIHDFQPNNETNTNDIDADYYFLMSLLPHLRDVSKKRKMAVRQALQQVLINEGSVPT